MYGTGWMAPGGTTHKYGDQSQAPYQPPGGGYNYGPPPPQYSQETPNNYTGNTYNSNNGYYGQNTNSIPLQSPPHVYTPGGPGGYEPPPGPPPSKIA
jgi:hypothetical protein